MAITSITEQRLDSNTWRVSWVSDVTDPLFSIYRDGVLQTKQTQAFFDVHAPLGKFPEIEVRDDDKASPLASAEPTVVVQWASVASAARYKVEEFVAAAWVLLTYVEVGTKYETTPLTDNVQHQYRVTAVDANGIEGATQTINVTIGRPPDVPEVSYVFSDSTKAVTITELV